MTKRKEKKEKEWGLITRGKALLRKEQKTKKRTKKKKGFLSKIFKK